MNRRRFRTDRPRTPASSHRSGTRNAFASPNALRRWAPGIRAAVAVIVLAPCCGCVDTAPNGSPLDTPITSEHEDYRATVTAADGAIERGDNTLTVHVVDANGEPAALVRVVALMPVHGHTAVPTAIVAREPGTYSVEGLDLLMPGEWQITFSVSEAAGRDDDVLFLAEVP